MVAVVHEFFATGQFVKEFNATLITLVSKCANPTRVTYYRSIACCNTFYKCIANILAYGLKKCLPSLISKNQSVLVEGRGIMDNILLAQEIVKDYLKLKRKPKCTLKVYLMKAFDSVCWEFVINVLTAFNFPTNFVNWIWNVLLPQDSL